MNAYERYVVACNVEQKVPLSEAKYELARIEARARAAAIDQRGNERCRAATSYDIYGGDRP